MSLHGVTKQTSFPPILYCNLGINVHKHQEKSPAGLTNSLVEWQLYTPTQETFSHVFLLSPLYFPCSSISVISQSGTKIFPQKI